MMGLPQHSSTAMAHMASYTDHETTKGFSLLTSLRQHFAALRQQDASFLPEPDVLASQLQSAPKECCTPHWGQSYDLQHSSDKITALGSQALTSPDPQRRTAQPAKPAKKPSKSSVFLHDTKLRCHKQRQHHRRHKRPEKNQEQSLCPALHSLAEEHPETGQRFQLESALLSGPPEAVNCEAAGTTALGHTLQFHHMCQNACTPSLGQSSTPNQQSCLKQRHDPRSSPLSGAAMTAPCTTQASAHDSHFGCIRAQPRLMWQNSLKPTDSNLERKEDICLRLNQGRQSTHTFLIASDLSKAGQLRTQNLHAAVRGSLQLMHRFVVRRSAIAHMGVFTTGYLAAGELVMEYAGEVIRRSVADRREQQYSQQGLGLYFFALDKDHHIDATFKGNIARYINHSCRPNCVAKLVDVQGQHRVFIFTMQEIAPLEELTYDYKISGSESLHDASTKAQPIPCNCSSLLCRGSL